MQTVRDRSYTINSPIPTLTLPTATDGDGTLVYALTPALPEGLTFNEVDRQITGTPTQTQSATTYAYTATDADMDTASLVFDIAVLGIPAPSFGTQEIDDRRYTVNVPITAFVLPEAEGGNGNITYKLERTLAFGVGTSLPLGLRFDPGTRVLAGTPTRTQGAIEYTYTATDSVGESATLTFEIMVVAGTSLRFGTQPTRPPSRQTAEPIDLVPYFGVPSIDNQVYIQNDTIDPLTLPVAGSGNGALVYGITETLPAGLQFNGRTRQLTGTPTTPQEAKTYTYTATDTDGDTVPISFEITVLPDDRVGLNPVEDKVFSTTREIAPIQLPEATNADDPVTYEFGGTLPTGLVYDAATRKISGTPTATHLRTKYTWSAADRDGDSASIEFHITVVENSTPSLAAINDKTYSQDLTITPFMLPEAKYATGTRPNEPLTYKLEPQLPDGLSLNLATRQVSGTPSIIQTTTHKWSVTDNDGEIAESSFSITVVADSFPIFDLSTLPDQYYFTNVRITPLDLPVATGGNAPVVYRLTPDLPAGLNVSGAAGNRQIEGTPTATLPTTPYSYTATDRDNQTATVTFNITVEDNTTPGFGNQKVDPQTYRQRDVIPVLPLPAATGGNGTLTYSLKGPTNPDDPNDVNLPPGLTFNASTRQLTGEPTGYQSQTDYTYTVTDDDHTPNDPSDDDSSSLTVKITIQKGLGVDSIGDRVYTVGSNISPLLLPDAQDQKGNVTYTFADQTSLPKNLSFVDAARYIFGKPSENQDATTFTYSVTEDLGTDPKDDDNTVTQTFTIEVEGDSAPVLGAQPNLVFATSTDLIQAVTLVAATGGNEPLTYTLDGALPVGLTFNPDTRQITGTATTTQATKSYFYNVTDADGDEDGLVFTITVNTLAFNGPVEDQIYTKGAAIPTLTLPEASGGTGTLVYTLKKSDGLRPEVPAGLSFDGTSRQLTGTPTAIQDEVEYTYKVTDSSSPQKSAELTFTITVVDRFLMGNVPDQEFLTNVSVGVIQLPEATGGVGTVAYSLSPNLPAGLNFDKDARQITGVPKDELGKTLFTYTAQDSAMPTANTISKTFHITIHKNEQPILLGEVEDQTYIKDVVIDDLLLPLAIRGSEPYTYNLAGTLPIGLTFNRATRTISGTPSVVQTAVEYTYTATDTLSATAQDKFNITVSDDLQPRFENDDDVKIDRIADQFYPNGYAIDPLRLPDARGGNAPLSYRLNGTLAPGLAYNSADKTITGTPTAAVSATEYEWIATDVDGDSASVKFNITVGDPYDYDIDDDGLIEIYTLAQLAAIDYDWEGNGDGQPEYQSAFSPFEPRPNFGCNNDASACNGYELVNDLDFDTTGDGKANEPHPKTGTTGCVKDVDGNWPIDEDDCDYDAYWNDGKGWDPIGEEAGTGGFGGTFEGNGRTIANLYVYNDRTSETRYPQSSFVGLFAVLPPSARIRNLSIRDAEVSGAINSHRGNRSYVGIGAGSLEGEMLNVSVSGKARTGSGRNSGTNHEYAGGLVGSLGVLDCRPPGHPPAAIRRGHADVTVEPIVGGVVSVGGLVGRAVNDFLISQSSSSGQIDGPRYAGGLVGQAYFNDKDCVRGDAILDSFSSASVTAGWGAGGLAGFMEGDTRSNRVNIKGSYSTGTITSNNTAGGLIGNSNSYRIRSSYFAGQVVSTGTRDGGIVGKIEQTQSAHIGDIRDTIAIGRMPDESDGIVGTFDSGARSDIDDTYWDTDVTGIADPVEPLPTDEDQSLGKTTAELQNPRSATGIYENFDTNYWVFRKSCDYPVLKVDFDGDGIATWEEFGTQTPSAVNCPPIVINPIGARTVSVGTPQTILLEEADNEVFFDDEGDDLAYTLTVTGNDADRTVAYDSTAETITITGKNDVESFTVTVTASDGVASASDAFDVTIIGDAQPALESVPDREFIAEINVNDLIALGLPAEALQLPEATGGNSPITYALNPGLVSGLTFSDTTRLFSGTPTVARAATPYTYSATDVDGDKAEVSFNITVVSAGHPIFGIATIEDQYYVQNTPITDLILPPAIGGTGTISYTLARTAGSPQEPPLPPLLSFDGATRTLSGTPTDAQDAVGYTYTATDTSDNSISRTFNITIALDLMPSFDIDKISDQTYVQNATISALTLPKAVGGNPPLTYSLPSPPAGLTFDASARQLTGKPTAPQGATEYTYTVADADGDTASRKFEITIVPDLIPTLSSVPDQTYVTGKAIDTLQLPPGIGGDGALTYSLGDESGNVPSGLSFNAVNRTITGTPTTAQSATNYTYSVMDDDREDKDTGSTSFNITIIPNFTPDLGTVSNETYTANLEVDEKDLPTATGGNLPLIYSIVETLPTGLTFNPATRKITGTPTKEQTPQTYTYKVTDADGDEDTATFTIAVRSNSTPRFDQDSITKSFVAQKVISDALGRLPAATGGDAPITYTLTPTSLPAGLSFTSSTRLILGRPTAGVSIGSYVYTVTDRDQETDSMIVTISIVPDLDIDDDGLIEIYNKAQLNAMRWDLDGNGDADDVANDSKYKAAFAPTLQGGSHECVFPANSDLTECNGFELMNPLDYGKSGSFTPIGDLEDPFNATFNGNGNEMRDMKFVAARKNGDVTNAGLFGVTGVDSIIKNVNIVNGSSSAWTWNWKSNDIGNAGMIAGINEGVIQDSRVQGKGDDAGHRVIGSTSAGMVVGINGGEIHNTYVVSGNVLGGEASGLFAGRNVGKQAKDPSKKALLKNTYSHGWRSETKWKHQKIGAHVGRNFGNIDESYTVGLSKYRSSTRFGPLTGQVTSTGDVDNSYFISDSKRHERYGGTRKTLEQLQAPISRTGIYNKWDTEHWDFGSSTQLPALKADWDGDGYRSVCDFGQSAQGRATQTCPNE